MSATSSPTTQPEPPALSPRQLKQAAALTVGALALYLVLRWLPTGTNLQHADFQVAEGAPGSTLEFCDPSNPQFLPVVSVRSPVETRLVSTREVIANQPAAFTLRLSTATGKPIGPVDLLESHTRKLHVMAVDPTLTDYHHLHPEPGAAPGEWTFGFTPARSGTYRIFCDFTPAATARGLYASADIAVADLTPGAALPSGETPAPNWTAVEAGHQFRLEPSEGRVVARRSTELALTVRREDGGAVKLGEVMGAYAHLVAFDRDRSGFAHLHPREVDLSRAPDPRQPRLTFQVTIPDSGRYVIWAQLDLDGREVYVPFWFDVAV